MVDKTYMTCKTPTSLSLPELHVLIFNCSVDGL